MRYLARLFMTKQGDGNLSKDQTVIQGPWIRKQDKSCQIAALAAILLKAGRGEVASLDFSARLVTGEVVTYHDLIEMGDIWRG